jgi:hypothetical protein
MNNGTWAPIRYRDFWDVPRIFLATYRGELYLFDCPFDEEVEDFGDLYHVYSMPPLAEDELTGSWADLPDRALTRLGDVPIASIRFDPSQRKSIDPAILDELAARKATAG